MPGLVRAFEIPIRFIDDQPRNVAGGLACGLQAIHLDVNRPYLAFAEAARRLGLEVPGLQGPAR